ncbi:hypothetical protein BJ742DRAFT_734367 [Cladochytrium replicatum]|nr:hypothetical protein BJ742DRAFT_734367 [Cladochytrium replicatum]
MPENGHVQVLDWWLRLNKLKFSEFKYSEYAMDNVSRQEHMNVLDCLYGNVPVLDWWKEATNQIRVPKFSERAMDDASRNNHVAVWIGGDRRVTTLSTKSSFDWEELGCALPRKLAAVVSFQSLTRQIIAASSSRLNIPPFVRFCTSQTSQNIPPCTPIPKKNPTLLSLLSLNQPLISLIACYGASFAYFPANPAAGGLQTSDEPRLRRTQKSMVTWPHTTPSTSWEPDSPNLRDHYARQSLRSKFLQGGTEFVIISFLWIGLFFATDIAIERRVEYIAELLDESPFKAVGSVIVISLALRTTRSLCLPHQARKQRSTVPRTRASILAIHSPNRKCNVSQICVGLYPSGRAIDEALAVRPRAAFEPPGSISPAAVLWLRPYEPLDNVQVALATEFDSFPVNYDPAKPSGSIPMARLQLKPVGTVMRTALKHTIERLKRHIAGDIEIREGELFPVIDVMNPSPTVVKRSTVASKVFKTVRTLGLRQVLVVEEDRYLLGVVTRKDLVRLTEALHHVHREEHSKKSEKEQ